MTKSGFDIETLTNFEAPKYLCEKCYAILNEIYIMYNKEKEVYICPICDVQYDPTEDCKSLGKYLKSKNLNISWNHPLEHADKLATLILHLKYSFEQDKIAAAPLRYLYDLFLSSKKFIHIVSYGLSWQFMGILKIIARRVPIRCIISNASDSMIDELTSHQNESPNLNFKFFGRSEKPEEWVNSPHHKLIIIDGFVAIKGSANLTEMGWRKVTKGKELIEVEADLEQVKHLNNSLFSPTWIEGDNTNKIEMDDLPF